MRRIFVALVVAVICSGCVGVGRDKTAAADAVEEWAADVGDDGHDLPEWSAAQ